MIYMSAEEAERREALAQKEENEKLRADLDYLAMMVDIDIDKGE